jgi:hypothetical protein
VAAPAAGAVADGTASAEGTPASGEDAERRRRRRGGRGRGRAEGEGGGEGASAEGGQLAETGPGDDRVRLFVNRGSTEGFDEGKVLAFVTEAAGVTAPVEGARVQLRRTHAFVELPVAVATAAVEAAQRGLSHADRPVTIEVARTR